MKRFTLAACAGLLAAAMALPSFAADMSRPAFNAPSSAAPWNWTGFYVGINGGYGFGKSNWTNVAGTTGDFNVRGALAGGTIGYNLQTGMWVWGLEGDVDASWIKGTDATICCETKNDWLATARGRIGYAMDRWLPFLTGGAAFGDVKMTPVGFPAARPRPRSVGPPAAVSNTPSRAPGRPKSNTSMSISARRAAT